MWLIMGAKKSHDLATASRRTKKACGIIQYEPEGLRTRSANVQGQEEMNVPAQAKSRFDLILPYCSIQALSGLANAHLCWWGPSSLLSLLIQMYSFRNILTGTPRINVLPAVWAFLIPANWHIKLTITLGYVVLIYGSRKNSNSNTGNIFWILRTILRITLWETSAKLMILSFLKKKSVFWGKLHKMVKTLRHTLRKDSMHVKVNLAWIKSNVRK